MTSTTTTILTNSLKSLSLQSTTKSILTKPFSTTTINSNSTPATSTSTSTPSKWTTTTQRSGVLAKKHGMTCLWDSDGIRIPVTVLHLDNVQVISSNSYASTSPKQPSLRHSVIVGCSPRRSKTTSASLLGQFNQAGIEPKMRIVEFKVSEDAIIQPGSTFSAAHFVPGQYVDVQAPSIGKGFAGVMKKHNFAGLRASHGVSVSHRATGSTGQHQDPGRVFPGKKMTGRMGGRLVTTQNLLVYRIDTQENVLYIKGSVPGAPGTYVRVVDALKKVNWKSGERERKGLNKEGEVLDGIKGFPMPFGSVEMAREWGIREMEVGKKEVVVVTK